MESYLSAVQPKSTEQSHHKINYGSVQGSQQLGNSEKKRAGERAKKKTDAGRSR